MKDKKFDELMGKYVDSTKRGKEFDLQKLNNKSAEEVTTRRAMPRYVWAMCAALVVAVISLSIALPIALNKDGAQEEGKYYCDSSNMDYIQVDEVSQLKDKYNFDFLLPSIENLETHVDIMVNKENGAKFGAFFEIVIFDDYFTYASINVIKKPYVWDQAIHYESVVDSVIWRDTTVKYYNDDNGYRIENRITFTIGDYKYYIYFENDVEISVTQALDLLYCEDINEK